ncbi:adhesion G-protein coupled receptor F1-like [Anabas testudineus]|uniref:adhesion G-protein coupled receptor F1-like n=1 Tax=Anabas testudineus TaxID=64144 RepID=UPI000E45B79F|nr:adhesion G-protein coupled receptor F1-like [Anabas testudineus]
MANTAKFPMTNSAAKTTNPNTSMASATTLTPIEANITLPTTNHTSVNTNVPTMTPISASSDVSTMDPTSEITATPPASTVFDLEMSVRLQKEYTPQLGNATSPVYKELKSMVDPVLKEQYKGITGFVSVSVKQFREGSIIADFVVQTTQVIPDEMAEANQKLPQTMKPIAPVIGSVSAFYNSPTSIMIPNLTYTGSSMKLTCGPPPENIDVGQIYESEWKFQELTIRNGGRIEIVIDDNVSVLTVNNVILADTGPYKCTLRGRAMDFLQVGVVTEAQIKRAPNVRLQSEVNVRCTERQRSFPLKCCVQHPYTVKWFLGIKGLNTTSTDDAESYCITYNHWLQNCSGSQEEKIHFICRVDNPLGLEMTTTMTFFSNNVTCNDDHYGTGQVGDRSVIGCDKGQEGSKTAVCESTTKWKPEKDTCIITIIKELLIYSQDLVVQEVPKFVENVNQAVMQDKKQVPNLSATVSAVVIILNNIADASTAVDETIMQNVLSTVAVITGEDAMKSWDILNANATSNTSSELLYSLETLSNKLVGEFTIKIQHILLNRTTFNNSFMANLNSSININIPNTNMSNVFITTILFSSFNFVMPARMSTSELNTTSNGTVTDSVINAHVVLVKINATIQNVTLSYVKLNNSLTLNPQCVFWNFTLFHNLGAWDDEGCTLVTDINNTVTCNCNHLTSFSILMARDIPASLKETLDVITYIGIGISMASLAVCLIIEGYIWKAITTNSTAFMRHVSIVNTALSLLIGDICFIFGTSIAKNPAGADFNFLCSTATFLMHFFYLALFFWMLVSGLLLFYRTVIVFPHMSKSTMLATGFCLGYGCPLIIAAITIAVTGPGNKYFRKNYACWLNWTETKALLALVIPALTIVLTNILVVIVVLFKMLKRTVRVTVQREEKHTLVVIARCVIILTPIFGLTWSLGVGTMISTANRGIHIAFAFFNSLQGFLILVFGTLYDSKVRVIISSRTTTPSTGFSNNNLRLARVNVTTGSVRQYLDPTEAEQAVQFLQDVTSVYAIVRKFAVSPSTVSGGQR